jgi:hypothetical protein
MSYNQRPNNLLEEVVNLSRERIFLETFTNRLRGISVSQSSQYNVTTGTTTNMSWNVTGWSSGGYSLASGVLTVGVAGYHRINLFCHMTANATGYRRMTLLINDVNSGISEVGGHASSRNGPALELVKLLDVGDQVRATIYQSSGTTLGVINSGSALNGFTLVHFGGALA